MKDQTTMSVNAVAHLNFRGQARTALTDRFGITWILDVAAECAQN